MIRFFQDEDPQTPPDLGNADMTHLTSTLYEMSEEDVMAHCTNEDKCLCCRSYRGQSYHLYSKFVRVHGAGNQVKLKPPVLAYYRAAWFFDSDVPKASPCPPLEEGVLAALQDEPNPSQDTVMRFVRVVQRVNARPAKHKVPRLGLRAATKPTVLVFPRSHTFIPSL